MLQLFSLVSVTFVLQISHVFAEFPAEIKESTYQVSIRVWADEIVEYGKGHICSGILISNFTVLTAASCLMKTESNSVFYDAKELNVSMGNLNRRTQDEFTFYTHVESINIHGRFNRRTYANNLALLKLSEVKFGLTVIPVYTSNTKVYSGMECYVLGWRSGVGEILTDVLMKANITTVERNSCKNSETFPLTTFCSHSDNELESCTLPAEEGSPVICNGELSGVVSSVGTCDGDTFKYTDVSQLYYWIFLNHFDENVKLIDNKYFRNILYSTLDLIAYYVKTPKIADDFEVIKFFFK